MEIRAKTELLKHFQKVYNEEINESVKISNEEIEYFVDEYLLKDDINLKKVSDKLIGELNKLSDTPVGATEIKSDDYYSFKRELCGFIGDDWFEVYFRRDEQGSKIFLNKESDCKEQIKELIKSIEPRAIVN